MAFELVSNCRSNEISPVGVKAVLYEQIDMAKIDIAEVDCDFFGLSRSRSQLMDILNHLYHPFTIHLDGIWMVPSFRQGSFFGLIRSPARKRPRCRCGGACEITM